MTATGAESAPTQTVLVLTGPESSGKSALAGWLARQLQVPLVPEVARHYLAAKSTPGYTPEDVLAIATEQARVEQSALDANTPVVVADTDQRILRLWWAEKYPDLPPLFVSQAQTSPRTLRRVYLLCYPDLVWEPDPLRENPQDRARLFKQQQLALEQDKAEFRVIWGEGAIRQRRAWHYVQDVLGATGIKRARD